MTEDKCPLCGYGWNENACANWHSRMVRDYVANNYIPKSKIESLLRQKDNAIIDLQDAIKGYQMELARREQKILARIKELEEDYKEIQAKREALKGVQTMTLSCPFCSEPCRTKEELIQHWQEVTNGTYGFDEFDKHSYRNKINLLAELLIKERKGMSN